MTFILCLLLEVFWYIFFSNYQTTFIFCSSFPLSWCFCPFPFLLPSLVIWFIWFTSVNFHLCFFFFQFFIWPLSCLLRFGAALWLWFWGLFVSSWILPALLLAPPFPCDWCPLTFVALPSVPCLSSVWPVTFGHLLMLVWCLGDDAFDHLHTSHTLAPHSRTTAMLTPTRGHPAFPFNYPSPLSLRAAKVVKATAAVANNSSSPVKELRDLSAMDAFRSRSISVSEHAVRRLENNLVG